MPNDCNQGNGATPPATASHFLPENPGRGQESNGERITEALRLGGKAMATVILTEPIDLCWQPVVYRAAPAEGRASAAVFRSNS